MSGQSISEVKEFHVNNQTTDEVRTKTKQDTSGPEDHRADQKADEHRAGVSCEAAAIDIYIYTMSI